MPPKRKVSAVADDDDYDEPAGGGMGGGGGASQVVQAVDAETAEAIANKLCRFVLLREHLRKPVSRAEMKTAVMNEHNDRSGKVFKQVLAAANAKLKELAGLELVPESASGAAADDEVDGGGTQAGPSQAGASQSQAGATQSQAAGGGAKAAAKGNSYLLVNKLVEPIRTDKDDDAPAVYKAFVEVVLSFLQQSDGALDEEKLFSYLEQVGLERKECLPLPAEQEKVENLVQKRLVGEAWLRRTKKPNDPDTFIYVAGARAFLSRAVDKADGFRDELLADVRA